VRENTPSSIPLLVHPCTSAPLVKVNIDQNEYILKVDLGASCQFMLKQRVLDEIHEKKFFGNSKGFDVQGYVYEQPQFLISNICLDKIRFDDVTAIEESDFFVSQGSKLAPSDSQRIQQQLKLIDGRIGCEAFHSLVCFFDLRQSLFAIEMDRESMEKKHSLQGYLETSFTLDQGLVCLELTVDEESKKFLLDTGASRSALNQRSFSGNFTKKFQLEGVQLENRNFFIFDFPEHISNIDGILGIDFFKDHAICIDFPNQKILIFGLR
jgi:hypothetical protein